MARAASRVAARRGAGSVGRLIVILSINVKNEFHLTRGLKGLALRGLLEGGGGRRCRSERPPPEDPHHPGPLLPASPPPAGRRGSPVGAVLLFSLFSRCGGCGGGGRRGPG